MIKISSNPSSRARCAEDNIPMPTWTLGLTNAPVTFQSFMDSIFNKQLRKFLLIFFYSHIYNETWEDHLWHLDKILSTMQQSLNKLRIFFGICSYYQWFIKNFSQLTYLTKKRLFNWTKESKNTFNKLKVMTSCPIPSTTNFNQPFVLEYASGVAIGALLMQKGHPIPFES